MHEEEVDVGVYEFGLESATEEDEELGKLGTMPVRIKAQQQDTAVAARGKKEAAIEAVVAAAVASAVAAAVAAAVARQEYKKQQVKQYNDKNYTHFSR